MSKKPINIMLTETIAQSGNADGIIIDLLRDFQPVIGKYTLQVLIAGAGTAKIELFLSNDNSTFVEHTADVATSLTVGTTIYEVDPIECNFMKFKATETGTSSPIIVSMWFCAL